MSTASSDDRAGLVPKSDRALRDAVVSELAYDAALATAGVAVSVEAGVVTLTGAVSSYPAKVAAVRAAERVFGVSAVEDEIRVEHAPPVAHRPPRSLRVLRTEARLAVARRRIERLEREAEAAAEPARSRLQGQVDAVRRNETSSRSLVSRAVDEMDASLRRLDGRVDLAEHMLTAELAQDRQTYEAAVASMLEIWDTSLERLQAKAATRSVPARITTEETISRSRLRRDEIAASLEEGRADTGDEWRERRRLLAEPMDELCRRIDALSEAVEDGGEG
jgi:BON domain